MSQEKNKKLGFSKKSSGVVLKDVTKIFQQPDTGKDFVAVDHINLEIKDGEMVTLLGPSGCGKTTTLLQIDNSIEEASTILGADTGYSFRRITLPMLKNAFFSGIVYSFTKAITAVSAVIFLVSPRWKLVTSNIYSLFDLAKYGQAAAFVTMMVGILLVFIGLFNTVINLLLAPRSKVPQAKSKTEESK